MVISIFGEEAEVSNKYQVNPIKSDQAKSIVTKYHYSGKVVNNSKLHLGIYNYSRNLVGCLSYGPPMNGIRTSSKISDSEKMFELNRMVMIDDEPRNSESKAIGACNKWLRKNTDTEWLLSFSDGKESNVGYIYQATNWLYLGYIISDSFYDLDGDIVHNVTVWGRYRKKSSDRSRTTDQILYDHFENVSKIVCKQFVYVMPLKKNVKFNFEPIKQYPKMETEVPVLRRKWIKKNGVLCSDIETYTDEELTPLF